MLMCPSLLTIDKVLNEEEEDQRNTSQVILIMQPWVKRAVDRGFIMSYKEICSLCKGNGYITVMVKGKDETKQCWLCESKGEKEYSQAEVDDFIYKRYYKK